MVQYHDEVIATGYTSHAPVAVSCMQCEDLLIMLITEKKQWSSVLWAIIDALSIMNECVFWTVITPTFESRFTGVHRKEVAVKVKVKFSHTHYRALGPELILMYRQSAHRLSSDSRLPLLSARPAFYPRKRSPDGATPNWGNGHLITAYTTHLLTTKGWKAELVWLVDL